MFASNILILLLVVTSTLLLHFCSEGKSKLIKPFIVIFALLLFSQFKTTQASSLVNLTNDQIRIRDMRIREYPPVYIRIGSKAVWFDAAEWFEERNEFRATSRGLTNLSEVIDPNLYFFSNHPRERVGVNEFEKFPYVFLPFLAYGIISAAEQKRKMYLISFFGPILLISIIGNKNVLGPFSLFPFIVASISLGLSQAHNKLNNKMFAHFKLSTASFIVLTILILVQMYSYNVY